MYDLKILGKVVGTYQDYIEYDEEVLICCKLTLNEVGRAWLASPYESDFAAIIINFNTGEVLLREKEIEFDEEGLEMNAGQEKPANINWSVLTEKEATHG